MPTGTYDINDLLAVRFQSAAEFGLDTIRQTLEADIAAHNAIVMQMVSELCEVTTDRQRIYGTSAGGEMVEVDEYGRSQTQAPVTGASVASRSNCSNTRSAGPASGCRPTPRPIWPKKRSTLRRRI